MPTATKAVGMVAQGGAASAPPSLPSPFSPLKTVRAALRAALDIYFQQHQNRIAGVDAEQALSKKENRRARRIALLPPMAARVIGMPVFATGRLDEQHEESADREACRVTQVVVAERQSKARAQDGGRDPLRQRSDYRKTVAFCLPAGCVGLWSDFWIRHVSSPRKSVTVASNPDRSFLGLPQDQQLTWHRSVWAPNFWLRQTP